MPPLRHTHIDAQPMTCKRRRQHLACTTSGILFLSLAAWFHIASDETRWNGADQGEALLSEPTSQSLQAMNFDWGFVNPITNVSRVSCADTVANGAEGFGRHLPDFGDLMTRFHGEVGATYVVECPAHCGHYGAPVYGPGDGSLDDEACSGLGSNAKVAAFLDDSSICRAAIAMRELGHQSSGLVAFRIVEPIPVYPACVNMPRKRLPNSLPWHEPYKEDTTVARVTSSRHVWHQWDWANRPDRIERYGGADECCNDTVSSKQTSQGGCCAIQKYRQHWTGGQSGFWYGVRAFEIIGGQTNFALHVSGTVDALVVSPTCLGKLLAGINMRATTQPSLAQMKREQPLSVECWVRHLDMQDAGDYVSMGQWQLHDELNPSNVTHLNGVHLGMLDGKYCWSVVTVSGDQESLCAPAWVTAISRGNWTHLVGTYDGTHMQLFVNGTKLETSSSLQGAVSWPATDVFKFSLLGMSVQRTGSISQERSTSGEIDEVKVWKRILSYEDIAKSIGLTLLRPYHPDLVLYHRFDGQAEPQAGHRVAYPEVGGVECALEVTGDVDWIDSSAPVELLTAATSAIIDPASNRPLQVERNQTLEILTEEGLGLPPSLANVTAPAGLTVSVSQTSTAGDVNTSPAPSPSPTVQYSCSDVHGQQEELSDKCFFVPDLTTSWYGGEEECLKYGGHLASVSSDDENDLVYALYVASGAREKGGLWLGYSDDNLVLEQAHENKWVWSDASGGGFTNWAPHRPTDAGEGAGDCALMWEDDKMWDDQDCGKQFPFVCAIFTRAAPEPPPVEASRELVFAPFVRHEIVIRDPEGRSFKFDREHNVVRLNEGEELKFDVITPPLSDRRFEYDRTEYVALKHWMEDGYFRHQGYVTHLTPWVGYVADTSPLGDLAYDYAWKFIDSGSGTFSILNDFSNGWYLGYDADRDEVRIVDSGEEEAMQFSVQGVQHQATVTTTVTSFPEGPSFDSVPDGPHGEKVASFETNTDISAEDIEAWESDHVSPPELQKYQIQMQSQVVLAPATDTPPSKEPSRATSHDAEPKEEPRVPPSPPPRELPPRATEPPGPPKKLFPDAKDAIPPLAPPPALPPPTPETSSDTRAWPDMAIKEADWMGAPLARSVAIARNAHRVATGSESTQTHHTIRINPTPARPQAPKPPPAPPVERPHPPPPPHTSRWLEPRWLPVKVVQHVEPLVVRGPVHGALVSPVYAPFRLGVGRHDGAAVPLGFSPVVIPQIKAGLQPHFVRALSLQPGGFAASPLMAPQHLRVLHPLGTYIKTLHAEQVYAAPSSEASNFVERVLPGS